MTDDEGVLEGAASRAESLAESLGSATGADTVADELDDLVGVAEETAELLETVDVADAAGALDPPELVELGSLADLREAVETADPTEAADIDMDPDAIDVGELKRDVDLRAAWHELRELEEAIAAVVGDDSTDADAPEDAPDMADDPDTEELALAAQAAVSEAVESFREEILAAHDRLAALVSELDDRSVDSPNSRNPTAFSTLPGDRPDVGGAARYSTIPRETRHSSAPNYERVYGSRFESGGER